MTPKFVCRVFALALVSSGREFGHMGAGPDESPSASVPDRRSP